MAKQKYLDLDFSFSRHPRTSDVSRKSDANSIKQALVALIKTQNFERPFHPEIGCQVYSLLFEQRTPGVFSAIERTIRYTIQNFEERVELIDVKVSGQGNTLFVTLTYKILAIDVVETANFTIERTL